MNRPLPDPKLLKFQAERGSKCAECNNTMIQRGSQLVCEDCHIVYSDQYGDSSVDFPDDYREEGGSEGYYYE